MNLDSDQCYRALLSHDARFDGRFFVGVRTTRIYCRPVCTVKPPLAKNCRYFQSAAAAEIEGFRPCLRCRPELAPGFAAVDANRRLAQSAARLIDDGKLQESSLEDLAAHLAVTDRHLRRVFQQEFGVSPVEYAQTQRLLLAKRLLTDTDMTVLDAALASGFASLRRFNDLFRKRYRMTPGELRKTGERKRPTDRLSFDLAYRPPYDWPSTLAFLAKRAIAGVETVDDKRYRRTLRAGKLAGWIEVAPAPKRDALRVTVSASLSTAIPGVLSRVKALFDLACNPVEITEALGPLAKANPGLRLPGAVDGFEIAVRAILGQQVTVKAAITIAGRFVNAFGDVHETPHAGLTRLFPKPAAIATLTQDDVAKHGIIATRARAIIELARALVEDRLSLEPTAEVEATLAALEAIPGVGPWTAQYIAMRALAWPDAFPHPDVAVLKAMRHDKPRDALANAEAWRPWRAYAVLHLWKSLEKTP
ncbi:DNA-3-methyladenine glycosylase 2 [Betaproteobacteria bacterium GR16-43]|nr:DNA-3-methyladenine glycosylase 2 [Betaproteobacteria bacterium GR16-43]